MTQGKTEAERHPIRVRRWFVLIATPIVVFIVTQLDPVQNAEGWLVEGVTELDLLKLDVLADIIAPVWIFSLIAMAALDRALLERFEGGRGAMPDSALARTFLTKDWMYRWTWVATLATLAIMIMSWTREWERFGEQPDAVIYVGSILFVLAALALPVWWVRHGLFDAAHQKLSKSAGMMRIDRYLFGEVEGRSRWLLIVVLLSILGVATFIVLGQLDSLLKGMHLTGEPRVGINGLASVFEFDLSKKPGIFDERVGVWVGYAESVGGDFASGYAVASAYMVIDSLVLVPAYFTVFSILLLHARRTPPEGLSDVEAKSYAFIVGIGIVLVALVAMADLVENLMTWIVIDRAWHSPVDISNWTVRLAWFGSLFRTLGVIGIGAATVLVLAFRRSRFASIARGVVAVRGEVLVVVLVAVALMLSQTEDVIRSWTVSTALITTAFATALAVLVFYTSTRTLATLEATSQRVAAGEHVEPRRVRLPLSSKEVPLRRAVVSGVFILASAQVLFVSAGVAVGLGFLVPATLIALLWLFGIPIPPTPFRRGDREVSRLLRSQLPRLLGAMLFVVLGVAVVRSAVPQVVFARHADPWLVFALLPVLIGLYRIHTRSWHRMGVLEFFVVVGVFVVGTYRIVVDGDPELSPVALTFTGFMLLFGCMPFYYSYERDSKPSRLLAERFAWLHVQPLLLIGATIAVAVSLGLLALPLQFADEVGTIAIVFLGGMGFAAIAAAAVAFAELTAPPKILAAFRFRRTPVFVFLFAWMALASVAATGASNDIPTIALEEPRQRFDSVSVDDVWQRWVDRNIADGVEGAVPMVFVASSGGGLRAAVWTAYVLDCVFLGEAQTYEHCEGSTIESSTSIVAMSGVSGGSLGLASFAASQIQPTESDDWVKARLSDDYLAATMAWLILVDTPRSLIGFGPQVRDRAELTERAFEASWTSDTREGALSRGIFSLWEDEPDLPLLVFSGTSVNEPCRFNASVLSASPHKPTATCTSLVQFERNRTGVEASASFAATRDLAGYVCEDRDIRLSTAVLLSARFPVVSPSGRVGGNLSACGQEDAPEYVVDGGFLEASAASAATDLWLALRHHVDAYNASASNSCVVPFLIQIDNGYENPGTASSGTPREVLLPIQTLFASQFGRLANARELAAIEFDRPLLAGSDYLVVTQVSGAVLESRYARITTRAHPGVQAPLGWSLSSVSFDDLKNQLDIPENQIEIDEVASWFGELSCSTRPRE